MRRIIASGLFAATSPKAYADPPQLLQVVREPIKAGGEAAYEAIESDTAAACAALKCPHPHLALESLVGPREIWWFNFFESEAERLQVSSAYERNKPLMEVLVRNSEKKSKYTEGVTALIMTYRPDLGRGAHWDLSGVRFVVVTVVTGAIDAEGSVFEAPDGTYFVVQPVRTLADAEQLAGDPRAIVLAIRACWGMPAKDWVNADRDFWNANAAVSSAGRTKQ